MGLLRVGMSCFAVGLFVASVAAVAFGVSFGCTEAFCENPPLTVAVRGVALSGIAVFDGCNTCQLNPGVVGGALLSVVGALVGGVGVVGELRTAD